MAIQGNFPSIRPSLVLDFANSERLDPRVTFTRASTATYYDGVTVSKAEENLYLQSQTFGTTWATTSGAVSANVDVAPDGTSTADLFYPTSSGTYRTIGQTINFRTLSVFAKPSGFSWIALGFAASAGNYTWFDVTNGVVGTTSASVSSATITSVGNGWYRCVITFSADQSGLAARVMVADSDGSTTATTSGTNGILLWGAQAELRTAVTAYTATTTQAITNYVPKLQTAAANVARFDHTPTTGAALGLLVEESRQNLTNYSQEFSNAYWSKIGSTITADAVVAPDGTLTGDVLVENTASGTHRVSRAITVTSSTVYTYSLYAKAQSRSNILLYISGANVGRVFDLSTGTTGGTVGGTPTASEIVSVGNGWYRCAITFTSVSTTETIEAYGISTGTTFNYTGNGWNAFTIWGAQLEAGAFATSYIPTVASTVTRSADAATMTGTNFSSWYNASEGTLYAEATPASVAANRVTFDINNDSGTGQNTIVLYAQRTSDDLLGTTIVNNVIQVSITQGNASGKTVFAYKVNDFAATRNGATAGTDTSGLVPSSMTRAFIGDDFNGGNCVNGTIRKFAYYPLRLTNAQLQAITG
jgi:hypothetical protein